MPKSKLKGDQKQKQKVKKVESDSIDAFTPSTKVTSTFSHSDSVSNSIPNPDVPFQYTTSTAGQLLTLVFTDKQVQHATLSRIEAFYEDSTQLQTYIPLKKARQEKLCRNYEAFNFPLSILDRWLNLMKEHSRSYPKEDEDVLRENELEKPKGKGKKDEKFKPGDLSSNHAQTGGSIREDVALSQENQPLKTCQGMGEEKASSPSGHEKSLLPAQGACTQDEWWKSQVNIYEAYLLEVLQALRVIDLNTKSETFNGASLQEEETQSHPHQAAEGNPPERLKDERVIPRKDAAESINEPIGSSLDRIGKNQNGIEGASIPKSTSSSHQGEDRLSLQPDKVAILPGSISTSPAANRTADHSITQPTVPIYLISICSPTPSTILSFNPLSLFNNPLQPISPTPAQLAIQHEFLHFLYHTSSKFRETSRRIWENLTPRNRKIIETDLRLRGYSQEVFIDEFQAYILSFNGQSEFGNSKELKQECLEASDQLRLILREVQNELETR